MLYFIDLFSGAGGVTTGIHMAGQRVVAAVNHDPLAIASHAQNHNEVLHFEEDIRTLDISPIVAEVNKIRNRDRRAIIALWASLECTNFSKAKGGKPRDADSRTLAEHLFRYIEGIAPDAIFIENVEEFMSWGPMHEGKPISRHNGRDYLRWVRKVQDYGYNFDSRVLNCADYGCHTTRFRFFAIFAKPHFRIAFPQPTHGKVIRAGSLFDNSISAHKPVRECLDLDDHGRSIFERGKPLAEKTLQRIYAGLIKFVAERDKNWMLGAHSCISCRTTFVPAKAGQPIPFLASYYSGNPAQKCRSIEGPCPTLTTIPSESIVVPICTQDYLHSYTSQAGRDIDRPFGTITTQPHHYVLFTEHRFICSYYGNNDTAKGLDEPCDTVTTKDRHALCAVTWLDKQYGSGDHNHQSIDQPCGAIPTVPKLNQCTAFVMATHFNNAAHSVDAPHPVITADRHWHYLVNPQWGTPTHGLDKPCPTIIARQDKTPLQIATALPGTQVPAIDINDSPTMAAIKLFMLAFGLSDLKMRMLKVVELKRITGFPEQYILLGSQAAQKKFIGNAVPPGMVRAIIKHFAESNALVPQAQH